MQQNERNEPALGFVRNDGRITRPASCVQDEGIVQPVSKEMDQLSRRLHHYTPPGRPGGVFFCLFFTILKLMRRYRSVLGLDPCDAAYIAGLIDGEGTITLSREHRNENRRLVVSIASTQRCLLEFVADRTGCGKITNKRTTSEPHTLSFAFRVTNRQALELLRQVRPYLRSYKAARAALALKHYLVLTPRNGQYTTGQTRARQEFETFFLATTKNGTLRNDQTAPADGVNPPSGRDGSRIHAGTLAIRPTTAASSRIWSREIVDARVAKLVV